MSQLPNKLVAGLEEQFTYKNNMKFNQPIINNEQIKQLGIAYAYKTVRFEQENTVTRLNITVLDAHIDLSLLNFKHYESGENINEKLSKGILISKWLANKYNLQKGMDVMLDNEDGQRYYLKTADIHIGLQGNELYTSLDYYKKMTNEQDIGFDGVFTNNNEADLSSYTLIEQQEVIAEANKTVEQFEIFSLFILMIGIVLALILLAIALYIVLQNGQKHMLLLKTIGYSNRQVTRITIEGYLLIIILGIIISVPYL